ncbi:MAG: DNA repair protein RadC [Chlamydiales bacterium]|nr:DNA repair protein RadC [Chlamydiales bacterium]
MRIKQLPLEERPRERLEAYGELTLSNTELIAVILGSGTKGQSVLALAQELLGTFGSLTALTEAGLNDLCTIRGLGKAKAIQLKAALGLGQRLAREGVSPKYPLSTPEQAYFWIRDRIAHQKKEIFGAILQDVRGNALRWEEISVGTLTQTLVHPREVFSPAIRHSAAGLILAHNHPSGDPSPSQQDIILTRTLVQASKVLGIPINDHIIVSNSGFVSLKQEGIIKVY